MRYDKKNIIIYLGYKENILYFCHSLIYGRQLSTSSYMVELHKAC